MNKNKFFKISLLAIIIFIFVIGIVLIVNSLNANDDKKEKKLDISDNPETFEGKIIEIKEDNTIVIEVTAERTSLIELGERVKIKYCDISARIHYDNGDIEDITDKYEMQVGDIVNGRFWKEDLQTEGNTKFIDFEKSNGGLSVYFSDYENRTFI